MRSLEEFLLGFERRCCWGGDGGDGGASGGGEGDAGDAGDAGAAGGEGGGEGEGSAGEGEGEGEGVGPAADVGMADDPGLSADPATDADPTADEAAFADMALANVAVTDPTTVSDPEEQQALTLPAFVTNPIQNIAKAAKAFTDVSHLTNLHAPVISAIIGMPVVGTLIGHLAAQQAKATIGEQENEFADMSVNPVDTVFSTENSGGQGGSGFPSGALAQQSGAAPAPGTAPAAPAGPLAQLAGFNRTWVAPTAPVDYFNYGSAPFKFYDDAGGSFQLPPLVAASGGRGADLNQARLRLLARRFKT